MEDGSGAGGAFIWKGSGGLVFVWEGKGADFEGRRLESQR